MQVLPYQWCGEFSNLAELVLTQHVAQSNLDPTHEAVARWAEFCQVHAEHHLNFQLFDKLLEKLVRPLLAGSVSDDNVSFLNITKMWCLDGNMKHVVAPIWTYLQGHALLAMLFYRDMSQKRIDATIYCRI